MDTATISDPRFRTPDAGAPVSDPAKPISDLPSQRPQRDRTTIALMAVAAERGRQERLLAAGKFTWSCASLAYASSGTPIEDGRKLGVLMEEVGEVAKEINEGPDHPELQRIFHPAEWKAQRLRLRAELVQVAAVATAFVESIDAQLDGRAKAPVEPDDALERGGYVGTQAPLVGEPAPEPPVPPAGFRHPASGIGERGRK